MIRAPCLICSRNSTHMASWQWVGSIFFMCLEFGCELLMSTSHPLCRWLSFCKGKDSEQSLTLVSLCHNSRWGTESSILCTPSWPNRWGDFRSPEVPSISIIPIPWTFPYLIVPSFILDPVKGAWGGMGQRRRVLPPMGLHNIFYP